MSEVKLGDIADIITGPFGSALHKSDYRKTGTPVIMPQDIGDRTLSLDSIARIGDEDVRRLARYATIENDIVYARRGDVEKHAFITRNEAGALCGTGCLRVRVDNSKADPLFVSFFLNRPESRTWLRQHAVGSNMPNLNTDILSALPLDLPDIKTQQRVGNLLRLIDDKIENNKRLMAELEATARLVYDEWFVRFDFPDVNGKPYRSSGGTMVWNDELKREIPEGWNVGCLADFSRYSNEKVDATELNERNFVSADNMVKNYGGLVESDCVPGEGDVVAFDAGDTLFSNIRPYFKKACIAPFDGGCSADILVFRPVHASCAAFIYLTLTQEWFIQAIVAGAKGSKMPRGDKDLIMALPFAAPPKTLLANFQAAMNPLTNKHFAAEAETRKLSSLRDWLLPMLMNGQVKVG